MLWAKDGATSMYEVSVLVLTHVTPNKVYTHQNRDKISFSSYVQSIIQALTAVNKEM
jgi:hypothetical protein